MATLQGEGLSVTGTVCHIGEGRGPGAAGGQDKGRRRGLCVQKKEQGLF